MTRQAYEIGANAACVTASTTTEAVQLTGELLALLPPHTLLGLTPYYGEDAGEVQIWVMWECQ